MRHGRARYRSGPGGRNLEEVWFQSGPDTLSGFLLLPEGTDPFPAFVLIQGSGPASIRQSWEPGHWPFSSDIAVERIRRGFVVLDAIAHTDDRLGLMPHARVAPSVAVTLLAKAVAFPPRFNRFLTDA